MRWFELKELRVKISLYYRPLHDWDSELPQISKISWDKIQFTRPFPKELWNRLDLIKIHFLFGKTIKSYEFLEDILTSPGPFTNELSFYLEKVDKNNFLKDLHLSLKC